MDNIAAFYGFINTTLQQTPGTKTSTKLSKLNDKLSIENPTPNVFGPTPNERVKTEEAFLKFFANAGLSLYSTTDSNLQNWNKLTLSNNNQERITPIPCN